MLLSIKALHDSKIIHRDIKPGNFCISAPLGVKDEYNRPMCHLIDFGLSRRFANDDGSIRQPRQNVGFRMLRLT
jgi:tau tubulin kinase